MSRSDGGTRPSVILIHGAANSAPVWHFWHARLATLGWHSQAIDLRGHGAAPTADLAHTSMADYADDVAHIASSLAARPIVIGWSMGGLVAMMVAARGLTSACVALAPSAPSRQVDESAPLRSGVFDAREYGIVSQDPSQQPEMTDLDADERTIALSSLGDESRLARDERTRGVVVGAVACPLLVVTAEWEANRQASAYREVGLDAEYISVEACSHWGLVLRRALSQLVPHVGSWMSRVTCG